MFIDRNKLNNYSIDLGDTKVLWHHYTPIIVPEELTLTEERYLLASQQTLFCGNTSVDNILKSQFDDYEDKVTTSLKKHAKGLGFKKVNLVSKTLKQAKIIYNSVYDSMTKIDFSNSSESNYVCEIIFKRLHSSFKACRFLIKYGYYFETYAIQRQILEQIAFAYHVSNNKTYVDYNSPPTCVTELKKFYPKVGPFYGQLSNRTHIDKTQIMLCTISDENNNYQTILNSLDFSLDTLYDYIRLLDIYCCTYEYCFRDIFDSNKSLSFITRQNKLRTKRASAILGEQYRKKYKSILEEEHA